MERNETRVFPVGKGGFETVRAAFSAAKEEMKAATLPTEYRIALGEGTHRIDAPLTLTDGEVDPALVSFTLEGAGDKSVLTSLEALDASAFAPVEGEAYWRLPLSDAPLFRFLYVNGKICDMAHRGELRSLSNRQYITRYWRQYNNGITAEEFAQNTEKGGEFYSNMRNVKPEKPKMYLDASLFSDVEAGDFGRLEIHMEVQWKFNVLHVTRVDFEDTLEDGKFVAVYFREDQYFRMQGPAREVYANRPYWLQNAKRFLREFPETYFYDRHEGALYYRPAEGVDPRTLTFEIPRAEQLFVSEGINGITLKNLTLTGTDHLLASTDGYLAGQAGGESKHGWPKLAAVVADRAEGFTVENCLFTEIASDALNLRGRLRDVRIKDNRFFGIGATAIRVGVYGITRWSEASSTVGLLVEGNYMKGIARFQRESNSVMIAQVKDAKILYNTVRDCSYTAFSIGVQAGAAGWTHDDPTVYNLENVEIAHNFITDFMTDMRDGGAIYTLGGNAEVGYTAPVNRMHHNFVIWSKKTGDAQANAHTSGLYNDNCSSNWLDDHNVQALHPTRRWSGMFFHYVQRDAVHDVYIKDNHYFYTTSADAEEQFPVIYRNINGEKNVFEENTSYYPRPEMAPSEVFDIIREAGSPFAKADPATILTPNF